MANIGRSIWSLFTGKSSIKETFRKSAGSIAHAIVSNVPGLSGFAGAAKSAVDGIAGVSGFHHD